MDLETQIGKLAEAGGGTYGVAAKDLGTGRSVRIRSNEVFGTASVIKVAVMVELYRRAEETALDLAERMELSDEHRAGGAGFLKESSEGLRPTLRDLCVAMIAVSDNTATNMLVTTLGIDAINSTMSRLGLENTRLNRLIGGPVRSGQSPSLGLTTPDEMLRLFEGLSTGGIISPRASAQMLDILARQQHRDLIPRLLPINYDSMAGQGDPRIAHKTGSVNGVRADVALLTYSDGRTWVMSLFSKDLRDHRWSVENEGEVTIARIARAIHDAWT